MSGNVEVAITLGRRLGTEILARDWIEQAFQKRVEISKPDNCWIWTGYKSPNGYGRLNVRFGRRTVSFYAHRLAYELERELIRNELVIDHLCRNKLCVNPSHLEVVPQKENVLRGDAGKAQKARTHCPRGHEYNEENTSIDSSGKRKCRMCKRYYWRA